MKFSHYFIIITSIIISGCASIIDGKEQVLTFNSEPENATVIISGKKIGRTPVSVPIRRDKNLVLEITKEGYKPYKQQVPTTTNPWVFGNVIFGLSGLISTTIDNANGAMTEFSSDQFFVTLTPNNQFSSSASTSRKIKEFIIAFGDSIKLELANNGGEKTNSLVSLIGSDDINTTTAVLKKLSDKSKDDLDFAMKVISFYEIK